MTNTVDFTTQVTDYATRLFNLAPAPFTILIVLAVGYGLRLIRRIPNDLIPAVCMIVGTVIYPALVYADLEQHPSGLPAIICFLTRSLSTGFVLGLATWLVHEKFLSEIEGRIPLLGKLLQRADSQNPPKPQDPTP